MVGPTTDLQQQILAVKPKLRLREKKVPPKSLPKLNFDSNKDRNLYSSNGEIKVSEPSSSEAEQAAAAAAAENGRVDSIIIPAEHITSISGTAGSNINHIEQQTGASLVLVHDGDRKNQSEELKIGSSAVVDSMVEKITIPTEFIRRIIGNAGTNIKQIRNMTGVDYVELTTTEGIEEVLTIVGSSAAVDSARKSVMGILSSFKVERITIPTEFIRRILGPAGNKIRQIENKTGSSLSFKTQVLTIAGSLAAVDSARKSVMGILSSSKVERITIPIEFIGRILGPAGNKIMQIENKTGASLSFITLVKNKIAEHDEVLTITGSLEEVESAKHCVLEILTSATSRTSCRMKVAAKYCGAIMGVSGRNIKNIQTRTGARLEFDSPTMKDYRVLTISGSSVAVESARSAVENILEKSRLESTGRLLARKLGQFQCCEESRPSSLPEEPDNKHAGSHCVQLPSSVKGSSNDQVCETNKVESLSANSITAVMNSRLSLVRCVQSLTEEIEALKVEIEGLKMENKSLKKIIGNSRDSFPE